METERTTLRLESFPLEQNREVNTTLSRMETYSPSFIYQDTLKYQRSSLNSNQSNLSADTISRYGRTDSYGKAVRGQSRKSLNENREPRGMTGRAMIGFYNIFFWISGAAVFSIGVSSLLDLHTKELSNLFQVELISYHPAAPVLYWLHLGLLLDGAVVFLTGFFGCWSSIHENSLSTSMYLLLVLLCCVGEISLAILAVICRDKSIQVLETEVMAKLQVEYNVEGFASFSRSLDLMQAKFECCGLHGQQDYASSAWQREVGGLDGGQQLSLPLTCCVLSNKIELTGFLDPAPADLAGCQDVSVSTVISRYEDGCLDRLVNWGSHQFITVAGVSVGCFLLHSLGVILTCCLLHKLRRPAF